MQKLTKNFHDHLYKSVMQEFHDKFLGTKIF